MAGSIQTPDTYLIPGLVTKLDDAEDFFTWR